MVGFASWKAIGIDSDPSHVCARVLSDLKYPIQRRISANSLLGEWRAASPYKNTGIFSAKLLAMYRALSTDCASVVGWESRGWHDMWSTMPSRGWVATWVVRSRVARASRDRERADCAKESGLRDMRVKLLRL